MSKTIINGIDVSECQYFNKVTYEEPYCNIDQERLYTCSSDENCYFKQLKRLQEENEELKEKKDEYYLRTLDYEAKISYLIQALEEIRDIAQIHQYFNPELLEIKGNIGQIQDLKMTEIYNKINEVLK